MDIGYITVEMLFYNGQFSQFLTGGPALVFD